MIDKKEILYIAKETGVHAEAVEREWVNGIFIDAISSTLGKDTFAIGGGTCRNKAYNGLPRTYTPAEIDNYFEQNRFSMDIDSFILPELNDKYHVATIICECSTKISNEFMLQIDTKQIKFVESNVSANHKLEYPRVDVTIPYYGPMYSKKFPPPRIKLTLDSNEPPVLNPTREVIYHPFSDNVEYDLIANCLSYPELFGNKLFALYNRKWGKDLYDVAILMDKYDIMSHLPEIRTVIETKKQKWHIDPMSRPLCSFFKELYENWMKRIPKIVAKPLEFNKCIENLESIVDALGIYEANANQMMLFQSQR